MTTKKAPAKKAPAKKAPSKKAPAKKAPARKAVAKKAPAKKAPSGPKPLTTTPFDDKFLEAQRAALLVNRETYRTQAESLQAEADALAAEREPGDVQFDDESGEGDTLAVERDFDLARSAQARETIEEIDHALAKIDARTYGICEASGQAIPKARLEVIPWARKRVEYQVDDFGRR